MNLDEAVRKFKGYYNGENGFDELDFKEAIIEWAKLQDPLLVSYRGQISALKTILHYGKDTGSIPVSYVEDAINRIAKHYAEICPKLDNKESK